MLHTASMPVACKKNIIKDQSGSTLWQIKHCLEAFPLSLLESYASTLCGRNNLKTMHCHFEMPDFKAK